MKTWRWFVGQVARLRRSIAGVFPLAVQRRQPAGDLDVPDEPAAGPPEHWLERVRRGAPGLLEPHPEVLELVVLVSAADPGDEAPAAQDVHQGQLLDQAHGLVERQYQDRGPEPDRLRAGGAVGGQHER